MTSATGPASAHDRRSASDATGVVVLGACAAWSLITAAAHGGRPEGVLLAVLAVAAGYAVGRICGELLPVTVPTAGAFAGLGLAVAAPHINPGSQVTSPLGQTGATAALLTLSAGAACCAAWAARPPGLRLALRLLAAGVAVTAAVLGSTSGFVACLGVLLCSLAADRMRRRAVGLGGLALAVALVTGATWATAEDALPDGLTSSLEGQLTQHRVLLWHDALDMAAREPGLGIGPGRFAELSPTVTQTLPPDGKPHSAPFQQAAEQGIVGMVLLAAVFGWVLYALWRSPRPTPVVLTAGAALAALAAIASVGNALSFTTVTAGAGLLAGLATARPAPTAPTLPTG
ncbi:O-antigen ligase family protein [Streptomyces tauricus]|uniref:O-antigen ligase family protein n=1 Tax=Streptomyces tauricus TaxID=68274 RepID=A0ABZ1JRS1_9ACTN|nr:O-antigen ligase family protein [Streptomyces tauricus]MCW8096674.1 O-antigen ligase family protein [Streptomyces tauricus]